jgi:hypothetical protein
VEATQKSGCIVTSGVFHYAAVRSRLEALEIMLEFGADPSLKDSHGKTPLDLVAGRHTCNEVIAFEHFLLASHVTVRTCSDHRSLAQSFVGLSKAACDRITRWVQKVCVYNMTLEYIPGAQLEFADMLSRMMNAPEDAWESMDVIDARDFELHPLAAMCPSYMQYCFLHAEARREPGDTGPALAGLAVDDETLGDVVPCSTCDETAHNTPDTQHTRNVRHNTTRSVKTRTEGGMEGWRERTWGVVEVCRTLHTPNTDVAGHTAFALHTVV